MDISKRVGFPMRLLAFIIDNFFISVLAIILLNLLSPETLKVFSQSQEIFKLLTSPPDSLSANQNEIINSIRVFNSYLAAITILYMLVEAYSGSSFGKKMLSLQITDFNGHLCPGKKYITRYLLKNISGLSFILATSSNFKFILNFGQFLGTIIGLGFLLTLNAQALGIHDIIAKTCVINKKDLQLQGDNNVPSD